MTAPAEGRNFALNVMLHQGTPIPTWYIAPYEGDYTPTDDLTAATFPSLATECTAYTAPSRIEFKEAAASAGATDNSAELAEFTFNATKTIRGFALVSGSAKGSTGGVILLAWRLASPKSVTNGSILRVRVAPFLQSVE